jgi:hypothetical protein
VRWKEGDIFFSAEEVRAKRGKERKGTRRGDFYWGFFDGGRRWG